MTRLASPDRRAYLARGIVLTSGLLDFVLLSVAFLLVYFSSGSDWRSSSLGMFLRLLIRNSSTAGALQSVLVVYPFHICLSRSMFACLTVNNRIDVDISKGEEGGGGETLPTTLSTGERRTMFPALQLRARRKIWKCL